MTRTNETARAATLTVSMNPNLYEGSSAMNMVQSGAEINLPLLNTPTLTMSSLEIAAYTGKRHDHIMRDIRKMLGELGLPKFGESSYLNAQGKEQPCFHLPKRETLILVSGYSVRMRAAIIDRWAELEAVIAEASSGQGVVTDLAKEVRAAIGGIVKGIVHKEMAEIVPALVQARLAESVMLLRHGKTAKQIWDAAGLPAGIRGATVWFGNRLAKGGCLLEGRADRGDGAVRLFDPDKGEALLDLGLLHKARVYVAERKGQGRLKLVEATQ